MSSTEYTPSRMDNDRHPLQTSYDAVASEYATRLYGELVGKPLDRELLASLAKETAGQGWICDLGCGPGQIARFLRDRGADVFGLDLSHGMLCEATRLNPDIAFLQADMTRLALSDASLAAVAAFYSIVHAKGDVLRTIVGEIARVLRPNGPLLLAFHVGDETLHIDELWDRPVTLDFVFHNPAVVEAMLVECGLHVEQTHLRDPYPDVEHPSRRAYIRARKP